MDIKKCWFINDNPGSIEDNYTMNKKALGQGATGTVFLGKHKITKFARAIKRIAKKAVKNKQRLINQINILKTLDHPNIIRLFETFEDERNLYLVMQLCEGGELFDIIAEKEFFSQVEAKAIFRQIADAVAYCHKKGICHRDLKPQNFMLLDKKEGSPIKVIDFGFSAILDQEEGKPLTAKNLKTKVGTPYYISPEVLQGKYKMSCDVWSLGVILYVLLSGSPPFYGDTQQQILNNVKARKFSFDLEEFDKVSKQAKDLITSCLQPEDKRITMDGILEHTWMKETAAVKDLDKSILCLKNFQNFSKMKKMMLSYFACQLNERDFGHLGERFKSLDKNGDGYLTVDEIRKGITDCKLDKLNDLLVALQKQGKGADSKINYTQFLASCLDRSILMKEDRLEGLFKALDADKSGFLTKDEILPLLTKQFQDKTQDYWKELLKEADKNGDGKIDYNEFIDLVCK